MNSLEAVLTRLTEIREFVATPDGLLRGVTFREPESDDCNVHSKAVWPGGASVVICQTCMFWMTQPLDPANYRSRMATMMLHIMALDDLLKVARDHD